MATPAERRAAQRRLAREINTGTYQKSGFGRTAREAAHFRSSSPATIRAGLEYEALQSARSGLGDRGRFNEKAVETRIGGGIAVSHGKGRNAHTEYFPHGTVANGVVTREDGSKYPVGSGKVYEFKGQTNNQLREMIGMKGSDWRKLAERDNKRGQGHRWFYH